MTNKKFALCVCVCVYLCERAIMYKYRNVLCAVKCSIMSMPSFVWIRIEMTKTVRTANIREIYMYKYIVLYISASTVRAAKVTTETKYRPRICVETNYDVLL